MPRGRPPLPKKGEIRNKSGKNGHNKESLVRRLTELDLRDLCRERAQSAIDALVEICERGKSETAKVAAANSILDRGFGKPSQSLDIDIHAKVQAMPRAEVVRRAEQILTEKAKELTA